jgi:hypothetical protein
MRSPGISDEALFSAATDLCRMATVQLAAGRVREVEMLVRRSADLLRRRGDQAASEDLTTWILAVKASG